MEEMLSPGTFEHVLGVRKQKANPTIMNPARSLDSQREMAHKTERKASDPRVWHKPFGG